MKKSLFILLSLVSCCDLLAGQKDSIDVYFIPGQGADERLFDSIQLEGPYKVHFLQYHTPTRKLEMTEYARELALQIDTNKQFILIGTSLGGMLATEMTDFSNPELLILISSAKCRRELPGRYRFQKFIPLFEIFPPGIIKLGARVLQPIVEKDSKNNRETFKAMMMAKDPKFLKRTIRMIINWEREECDETIIHLHGTKDKTIPIRNVEADYEIKNGSHMITLTRAQEINVILNEILKQ